MTTSQPQTVAEQLAARDMQYVPANGHDAESVNQPLTRKPGKRAKRDKGLDEYLSACRRFIRAAGRRIELEDAERLGELMELRKQLDDVIAQTAIALHNAEQSPLSWGEIGRQLGMTRQAAQQRWGKR